jgi:hypothetical protein
MRSMASWCWTKKAAGRALGVSCCRRRKRGILPRGGGACKNPVKPVRAWRAMKRGHFAEIPGPRPRQSIGLSRNAGQRLQVGGPRPGFNAKSARVPVRDLRVDQRPAPGVQAHGEGRQGDGRGPGLRGIHAFAAEHPADGQPVQSADEGPAIEHLDAVRMAEAVQFHIGLDHRAGDPRPAILARPGQVRAGLDDPARNRCRRARPTRTCATHDATSRRQMDAVGTKYRASRRAPPQGRLILREPREDAADDTR